MLQQESGEIELSIKYFVWALISNPKGSKFMRSFLALIVQLQEVSPKLWEHFLRLQHLNKKNLSIEIHCLELISFVLRGKLDLLKNRTRAIKKRIKTAEFEELPLAEKKFVSAYVHFIDKFDQQHDLKGNQANNGNVFHLGDSHCLTYAYRSLTFDKTVQPILPKIIFGAKAWHFARAAPNQYKAIFNYHITKIPKGSKVFLSFGEIDCRREEGIIKALVTSESNCRAIVDRTVRGYVDFVFSACQNREINLIFFGVPAPVQSTDGTYLQDEKNLIQLEIIKTFNEILQSASKKLGGCFVDTFGFTSENNGKSNNKFHIDPFHLSSRTLSEVRKQLKISNH